MSTYDTHNEASVEKCKTLWKCKKMPFLRIENAKRYENAKRCPSSESNWGRRGHNAKY